MFMVNEMTCMKQATGLGSEVVSGEEIVFFLIVHHPPQPKMYRIPAIWGTGTNYQHLKTLALGTILLTFPLEKYRTKLSR